jgi:hypothetical protein
MSLTRRGAGSLAKWMSPRWKRLVVAVQAIGVNGIGLGSAVLMTNAACAPDTAFTVNFAPEFPRSGSSVSVFGVFNDGQLNSRSWDYLRLRLPPPFNKDTCEAAYGDKRVNTLPAISSSVDDYARRSGVTDELLDQFAPMAKGDAIMLVTVAGHVPLAVRHVVPGAETPQPKGPGGQGGGGAPPDRKKPPDRNEFELSASFFSVRLHRSVALVDMTYRGQNVDEAFAKFAKRFAAEMPSSTCSSWNWDVQVDEKRIQELEH